MPNLAFTLGAASTAAVDLYKEVAAALRHDIAIFSSLTSLIAFSIFSCNGWSMLVVLFRILVGFVCKNVWYLFADLPTVLSVSSTIQWPGYLPWKPQTLSLYSFSKAVRFFFFFLIVSLLLQFRFSTSFSSGILRTSSIYKCQFILCKILTDNNQQQ